MLGTMHGRREQRGQPSRPNRGKAQTLTPQDGQLGAFPALTDGMEKAGKAGTPEQSLSRVVARTEHWSLGASCSGLDTIVLTQDIKQAAL